MSKKHSNLYDIFRIAWEEQNSFVGEIIYRHNGKSSHTTAYEIDEKAEILIEIPRKLGTKGAKLYLFNEYKEKHIETVSGSFLDITSDRDVYSFSVPVKKIGVGIYYFYIEIFSFSDIIYLYKNWGGIFYSKELTKNYFQLSVSDFKYREPLEYYGGVIYHIFVDRFCRKQQGNISDGSVLLTDWGDEIPEYPKYPGEPIKNNYFYGGTLYGIADKLDYISSLGVTLIYLSPIFKSPSNHKYDTSDYMTVDDFFGGEEALKFLVREAKKYGIGILLDGVFNHTGADSIYFNKYGRFDSVGAYQSTSSEFFPWYEFRSFPRNYVCWWNIDILPRINPDFPTCRKYFIGNGGVIDKYSEIGVAGFRLDVVDELSDSFVAGIKSRLKEKRADSILYGEVWEDASCKIAYGKMKKYFLGEQLDGVMNYPLRRGIISFLRDGSIDEIRYALTDIIFNAPKRIRDMQMNLLGSHDTERIITALGGELSDGKSNEYLSASFMCPERYSKGKALLLMAYTIASTLPGIPSVYYGDEVGLEGYSDPFNRRCFPWGKEDCEILSHYRKLACIRLSASVYKTGEYKLLYLESGILIFSRYNSQSSYITVINNRDRDLILRFKEMSLDLFSKSKGFTFSLKGRTSTVIKTRNNKFLEIIK